MAQTTATVNDLLNSLEAEDKGWDSEDSMLADMAEFRRLYVFLERHE